MGRSLKLKKAIVLLSGGLDSTASLYYAKSKGYQCYALIFDYGQKHKRELKSAVKIAKLAKVNYQIIKISLPWKGSSLLDKKMNVPTGGIGKNIPSTYVPARNIIFLSFAVSNAEAIGADAVFIGANAIDFSGYPDCRPEFYKAYQNVIKTGIKNNKIKIFTPLINLTKQEIVKLGRKLGAPLDITWSCYMGGNKPCGVCDSCRLRERGLS
ncbi:MAG: exsB protein [Candidatus Saganbacteria bacterium]|uniref:7-cyano-7-deazaguanine synthase n=1 Tax=Candidatus Saganbacteria bacterium TaxID=2575572 RepID=A0A833NWZ1_UNCSA|nr:MAG: exsB protein [Candidatus Saganbacteria bacterium]